MQPQTNQQGLPGTPSNIVLQDGTQLDPKVVKVMKAIRQVESGGDFNAVGDGGQSKGAYQWHGQNWSNAAQQILGDPNAPMTPANQNKVAYGQIKAYKDAGRTPEEIAALWNGAKKDPTTGLYTYINPEYGNKFRKALTGEQTQGGYQPPTQPGQTQQQSGGVPGYAPPTPPPPMDVSSIPGATTDQAQPPSFLQEAGQDIQKAGTGVVSALKGEFSAPGTPGHISPMSGPLQIAGSLAGGVTDLTMTTAEHLPIVGQAIKGIEGLIGQGVGALANTPVGKPIMNAVNQFATDHPELAKDIGAGMNIATAIPILKGLSAVKNAAMGTVGESLQNVAKKGVVDDMTNAMSKTKTLTKTFARNGGSDTIQNAVETLGKDAVPGIEGGKYATEEAFGNVGDAISKIEDEELQPLLKSASTEQVATRIPIDSLRQNAVQEAIDELKSTKPIEDYFDRLKLKYGDYMSLEQTNEAKRIVAKNISEAGFNSPTYDTDKVVRSALQQSVEDGAKSLNLPDVNEINARMGQLIKYQNILKSLDKTAVKVGRVRSMLQKAVGGATGVAAARMVGGGVPGEVVGGIIGEQSYGLLGKKTVGGLMGRLLNSK